MFKILLIEDNIIDAILFKKYVSKCSENLTIKHIEDGELALEFISNIDFNKEDKIDIIFLDLNLPKVNGMEILEKIRENKNLNNLKVIILSGSDFSKDIQKAKMLGADDYITKPINLSKLKEILSI